jgi:transcriptional regulator with XRE-family HTH domain
MNSLPSIDLGVSERLQNDPVFRQNFFIAESSAKIARQLIDLRKRRTLNQTQLAEKLKTGQPAISRVESADYLNWSFATLRKFAAALDARIQVIIQASEDVLPEYEDATEHCEEENNIAGSAIDYRARDAQQDEDLGPPKPIKAPQGAAHANPPRREQLASAPF